MKNFDTKHFLTMIGLALMLCAVWTLIILSIMSYAKYGDYPQLTHDPKAYADK